MVTTPVCQSTIQTISQYLHPIRAQMIVKKYCDHHGISITDLTGEDVARLMLDVATSRDEYPRVKDGIFQKMLKDLLRISNRDVDCRE